MKSIFSRIAPAMLLGAALWCAPASAGNVNGLNVALVQYGADGAVTGSFKQTGKTKWVELDPAGKIAFRFDEVDRDTEKVKLEDKSRGIALTIDISNNVITFGAIGDGSPQAMLYDIVVAEPEQSEANKSQAAAQGTAGTPIDQFIRSMRYDPRVVMARSTPGRTVTQEIPAAQRKDTGSAVIITEYIKRTAGTDAQDQLALFDPSSSTIYPGALVLANNDLADGRPSPLNIARAPIKINISLPGLASNGRVVNNPDSKEEVDKAVTELTEEFIDSGRVQPAQISIFKTRVLDSMQASADLGFDYESSSLTAKAALKYDGSRQKDVYVAFVQQIYYSVNAEAPPTPSGFFAPELDLTELKAQVSEDAPPAYVATVSYGRLLMVRAETSKVEDNANFSGEFEKTLSNGKISGNASASVKRALESASFSVFLLGGSAEAVKYFGGDETGLAGLSDYINEGAKFDKDNPGLPLAYKVSFVKDKKQAKINLTTEYIDEVSTMKPNSFIKINHTGGYVARFVLNWTDPTGPKQVETGSVTAPWSQTFPIPGDASGVSIRGEGYSGLLWDKGPIYGEKSWREAINTAEPGGPSNHCYTIEGTSLNQSWRVGGNDGACP